MKLLKLFGNRKSVSVLDATSHHDDEIGDRNLVGLRRSNAAITHYDSNYQNDETKTFEEPLFKENISLKTNEVEENNFLKSVENDEKEKGDEKPYEQTLIEAAHLDDPDSEGRQIKNVVFEDLIDENSKSPGMLQNNVNLKLVNENNLNESNHPQMMALYAAIIKGQKLEVKKLLTAHPNMVEGQDNFGRTPLMYCVLSDRVSCAKLLLKMGCELDQVDKAGRSALHLAAHKASYKILELLHMRGGSIHMKDKDLQTPLHLTTRNKHTRCTEFLLKRLSPGYVDAPDSNNRTALHWASAFNNVDCMKLLLKNNSNVALVDDEGKTPLHWAANNHHPNAVACVQTLLDYSPNVLTWQDYEGRTAIHYAVAVENIQVVNHLLSKEEISAVLDRADNSFRTPLHWAAQLGNAEIVKKLLESGAKNSISDLNGATPFLYAALNNNPVVILAMIEHEPHLVSACDLQGRNALMWASGRGAYDVILALLRLGSDDDDDDVNTIEEKLHGSEDNDHRITSFRQGRKQKKSKIVDVNATDNKGNTALHVSSWNGHARSCELLLSYSARHDMQNNMNHTALFSACEKGQLEVVKHLLDYNASIFLVDMENRSPLHWAALGGHADVCDFLIQKGLHQDKQDAYLRSPLHCAAFGGYINCMNLLLEHQANVDLQDKEGMSALHWAAQSGHLDAAKLLIQYRGFPNLMEFTEERLTPLDHALLINNDEMAQYLMEQGAFSSETIRNIAAARIQAYYRGYKMRKDFLRRKNLLMEHEMKLRNRKDRNKCKKVEFKVEEKSVPLPTENMISEVMKQDEKIVEEKSDEKIIEEKSTLQILPTIENKDDDKTETYLNENNQIENICEKVKYENFQKADEENNLSKINVEREVTQIIDEIVTSSVLKESLEENFTEEEIEIVVDVTEEIHNFQEPPEETLNSQIIEQVPQIIEETFEDTASIRQGCDETMESMIVEVTSQNDFCEVIDDSVQFFVKDEKCDKNVDESVINKEIVDHSNDIPEDLNSKIEPKDDIKPVKKSKKHHKNKIYEKLKESSDTEKIPSQNESMVSETTDESMFSSEKTAVEAKQSEAKVLSPIPEDLTSKNEPKEDIKPVKKSEKDRRKVVQIENDLSKQNAKIVRESSMISIVDTLIKTSNEYSDQFALKSEEKFLVEKPVAASIDDDVFLDEQANQIPSFSTIERPPPIGASEGTDVIRSLKKEKKKKSKKKRKSREENKQKINTPEKNTNGNNNNSHVQFFDSSMLMSEYIEGMLTLSPAENKILAQLQLNRKKALNKANNAATVIQNNWKRYKSRNNQTPVQRPDLLEQDPVIIEEGTFLTLPHQVEEIIEEESPPPKLRVEEEENERKIKEERIKEKEERRRRRKEKKMKKKLEEERRNAELMKLNLEKLKHDDEDNVLFASSARKGSLHNALQEEINSSRLEDEQKTKNKIKPLNIDESYNQDKLQPINKNIRVKTSTPKRSSKSRLKSSKRRDNSNVQTLPNFEDFHSASYTDNYDEMNEKFHYNRGASRCPDNRGVTRCPDIECADVRGSNKAGFPVSLNSIGRKPIRIKWGGDERVGTARPKKIRPRTVATKKHLGSSQDVGRGRDVVTSQSNYITTPLITREAQLHKIYGQLQTSYQYKPRNIYSTRPSTQYKSGRTSFSYNMDDGNF